MAHLELLFRVAERLDGFPRHIALHPCGIVLSSHDLVDRVPGTLRERPPDDPGRQGRRRAARVPEARRPRGADAVLDASRDRRDRADAGEKVDLERIPLDDEETFEMIRASDTLGASRSSLRPARAPPEAPASRWEDLIVDISLFRPGPVKSDMITPYLRRRASFESPVYVHPDLRVRPCGRRSG